MRRKLSIVLIIVLTLLLVSPADANAIMFGKKEFNSRNTLANATVKVENCTGVLVDNNWVMTAKHCKVQPNSEVKIGLHSKKEIKTVRKVIDHSSLDVSLLKLSSNVKSASPVKVLDTKEKLPIGTKTTAYGWGMTGFVHAWWLRSASGKIIDNDPYSSLIDNYQGTTNRLNGWSKIMPGDSGGPLFVNNQLYGIVSGGRLANNVKIPFRDSWDFVNTMRAIRTPTETHYSPSSHFKPWMDAQIRNN